MSMMSTHGLAICVVKHSSQELQDKNMYVKFRLDPASTMNEMIHVRNSDIERRSNKISVFN